MSNYTPGPWYCFDDEVLDANGRVIAHILTSQYEDGESVACDAWLIATAPETAAERDRLRDINAQLLAALESLVGYLADNDDEGLIEHASLMVSARAAIAKAKGE